jgi:hypothetical protein
VQRIKYKQLEHWQYQYLDTVFELLIDAKKNCKNRIRKTRKLLTIHGQHHLKADADHLYVHTNNQKGR